MERDSRLDGLQRPLNGCLGHGEWLVSRPVAGYAPGMKASSSSPPVFVSEGVERVLLRKGRSLRGRQRLEVGRLDIAVELCPHCEI